MQRKSHLHQNNAGFLLRAFSFIQLAVLYWLLLSESVSAKASQSEVALSRSNSNDMSERPQFPFWQQESIQQSPVPKKKINVSETELQGKFNDLRFSHLNVPVKLDYFGKVALSGAATKAASLYQEKKYDKKLLSEMLAYLAYQNKFNLLKKINLTKKDITAAFIYLANLTYQRFVNSLEQVQAAQPMYSKALSFFIELGADINKSIRSPFVYAIQIEDFELVKLLLKHGGDMYKLSEDGLLPLQVSCKNPSLYEDVVFEFLKNGYDVYHSNGYGLRTIDILNTIFAERMPNLQTKFNNNPVILQFIETANAEKINTKNNNFVSIFILTAVVVSLSFLVSNFNKIQKYFKNRSWRTSLAKFVKTNKDKEPLKIPAPVRKSSSVQINFTALTETVSNMPHGVTVMRPKGNKISRNEMKQKIADEIELRRKATEAAKLQEKEQRKKEDKERELRKAAWKERQEYLKKERVHKVERTSLKEAGDDLVERKEEMTQVVATQKLKAPSSPSPNSETQSLVSSSISTPVEKLTDEQIYFGIPKTSEIIEADKFYVSWVLYKIVPLINATAQPILQNVLHAERDFRPELDAIMNLCILCGDLYNLDRQERLRPIISANFADFLYETYLLRNKMKSALLLENSLPLIHLCQRALKIKPYADLNDLDYVVPLENNTISSVNAEPSSAVCKTPHVNTKPLLTIQVIEEPHEIVTTPLPNADEIARQRRLSASAREFIPTLFRKFPEVSQPYRIKPIPIFPIFPHSGLPFMMFPELPQKVHLLKKKIKRNPVLNPPRKGSY